MMRRPIHTAPTQRRHGAMDGSGMTVHSDKDIPMGVAMDGPAFCELLEYTSVHALAVGGAIASAMYRRGGFRPERHIVIYIMRHLLAQQFPPGHAGSLRPEERPPPSFFARYSEFTEVTAFYNAHLDRLLDSVVAPPGTAPSAAPLSVDQLDRVYADAFDAILTGIHDRLEENENQGEVRDKRGGGEPEEERPCKRR